MGLQESIVKNTLFLFNVFCFIGGLILTTIGAVVHKNAQEYIAVYNRDGETLISINSAIAVIVFGVIIFLIGFLGCCGLIKNSSSVLTSYSVVLFVIVSLEIGLCAYSLKKDNALVLKDTVEESFSLTFKQYDTNRPVENAWNAMQRNLKCCGIYSYENWAKNEKRVPKSCCKTISKNCADGINNQTSYDDASRLIYTEGCQDKILELITDNRPAIAGIVIGYVQLIGIFACCIAERYRKGNKE